MQWRTTGPSEDGVYIRINAAGYPEAHEVWDGQIDWGKIKFLFGEKKRIPITAPELDCWQWFGPIPFPPCEDDRV